MKRSELGESVLSKELICTETALIDFIISLKTEFKKINLVKSVACKKGQSFIFFKAQKFSCISAKKKEDSHAGH